MPMYKLSEYSGNYATASRSLWNCYREKIDGVDADDNASFGKSFEYETERVRETPEKPGKKREFNLLLVQLLNVELTVPFNCLSEFGRFLNLTLITCDIELELSRKKDCVLIDDHNNKMGEN